jgi:hypothetical protein
LDKATHDLSRFVVNGPLGLTPSCRAFPTASSPIFAYHRRARAGVSRTGTTAEGSMIISDERSPTPGQRKGDRVYDPDVLPRLQSLLATLADLDVAHGSNLLAIESRNMDNARKDQMIADLWRTHCKRRAPYLRDIEALRKRAEAAFD